MLSHKQLQCWLLCVSVTAAVRLAGGAACLALASDIQLLVLGVRQQVTAASTAVCGGVFDWWRVGDE